MILLVGGLLRTIRAPLAPTGLGNFPPIYAIPTIMAVGTPSTTIAPADIALSALPVRPTETRNHNFDYLRLFLALEVLALHLNYGLLRGTLWLPIPPVAAFVALSGFLIPQSLERSRSLGHFAWKRALRTLPALVPLMIAIAVAFDIKHVERAMVQYVSAGYHSQFQGCVLPLWSLIVEDGLYAVIAVMFVLGFHRNLWVTVAVIGGLLALQANIKDETFDYRFLQTSIGFFLGSLAFILRDQLVKLHWSVPAAVLGAAIAGWLSSLGLFVFPITIGSFVVLAMTLPQGKWAIPDLSYAIYIWHAPIMLALLGPWAMPRDARWVIATVVLTLIASALSWYLVEKPALTYKNWWTRSRANRPADQAAPQAMGDLQTAA